MNKISEKVLDFYKIMPFNIYGDNKIACNNIKKNPIYDTYPFLTKSLESSGSILDIGCGGGWLVNNIGYHYKSKKITGIDFNPIAIKFASEVSKKLNLSNTFEVQDLFKFKQEGFDLILSMGVLHHTDDCLAALDHVCKLGGKKSKIFIGLYHKFGRKPFLDYVNSIKHLNEDAKFEKYKEIHKLTDEVHLKSWFRDQVLHPHETQHTLSEVLEVFKNNNYVFKGTSINHFRKNESMDQILLEEKNLINYANEKIKKKIYYPGFFIVAGEKND
jgi:SAM-dependent methyltransferase